MAKAGEPKKINPGAELEPREGDLQVPLDNLALYAQTSLFAGQEKNVRFFETLPGSAVVRRFRKGQVVCRQGEPGWTAFYILTSEDALKLLEGLTGSSPVANRAALDKEKAALREFIAAAATPRPAATVSLKLARPASPKGAGWLSWFGAKPAAAPPPLVIPIDAPTPLKYKNPTDTLREGDLFGEASCFDRTPRSANVVADRDCYMLEMLRVILEQLKKNDPAFKKRLDAAYRERALKLQVLNIPLFSGLAAGPLQKIRDEAELRSCRAGQVLCDEHDRPDDMFLIRSGLVKVVKGVSALFSAEDVARWKAWAPAEGPRAEALTKLRTLLPADVQALLPPIGDFAARSQADCQAIAYGFNEVLKGKSLWEEKEFLATARDRSFAERLRDLPVKPEARPELDVRRLNRALVEIVLFGVSTFPQPTGGPETVLAYLARGEPIGEMGLMNGEPRSATCVAFIHPREGQAKADARKQDEEAVEVVRISRSLFDVLKQDPSFRAKVEEVIAARRRSDVQVLKQPVGVGEPSLRQSEDYDRLGLAQGQKLMLIDLDRCTRCDECVRACVATHDDGRSRLFLDGPRVAGRFLVPTTCRSCMDPVCMIGCPVSSIHRGANRQMVIEDWCIGCGLCEKQCPYGAIQMHDIGVIPEGALGWRYRPAEPGEAWTKPHYRDHRWAAGQAPFRLGRDFEEAIAVFGDEPARGRPFAFRLAFKVDKDLLKNGDEFSLVVTSPDEKARVWLNGTPLLTDAKPDRQGKRPFPIPKVPALVRAGRNVIAVEATPPVGREENFFDLRLDSVHRPNVPAALATQYVEKEVTLRAVVCDLCSGQPGKVPACVNACPHDAAIRFNARTESPIR
jgi:Fe-S-cluster-containing hydrogenase component 2/CRP-like cAMP-binding protein